MPNKPATPCTFCGQPATNRGRCTRHQRPTTTQRGYNQDHKRRRTADTLAIQQGRARCWRCKQPIHPTDAWDLGHDDHNRAIYRGPEHQACNRSAAATRQNST